MKKQTIRSKERAENCAGMVSIPNQKLQSKGQILNVYLLDLILLILIHRLECENKQFFLELV